jgi:hypothetical protein
MTNNLAFICHSSVDSATAQKVVRGLEDAGIPCWIAPRNISKGSTYAGSIIQGIKNSNLLIFIFTNASNKSLDVINEIEKAASLRIKIIPFKISNEDYSDALEYYLRTKQSINAQGNQIDEAIHELITACGIEGMPPPPPPPPPVQRKWLIPVALSLIILLFIVIYATKFNKSNSTAIPSNATNDTGISTNPSGTKAGIEDKKTVEQKPDLNSEVTNEVADIPAICGVGADYFFFVRKGNEGHVEYSSGNLGRAASQWQLANNYKVNGSAPGAASVGNTIYLVIRDADNKLLLCQGSFNGSFGDWLPMNFSTNAKPAIVAAGSNFYYFARNNQGRIFYNYAPVNAGGIGWREVDGNITGVSAPSAGSVGNHIFIAVTGTDNKIYYNQTDLGGRFNQRWDVMNFETSVAPTLVGAGGFIYFFGVKTNGEVWFNRALLGQSFEGWKIVEGNLKTRYAISAGTAGSASYIFLEMKADDNNFYLNQGFERFQDQWALVK